MKNKYSYIGLSFIILVFGIIFIPKIVKRLKGHSVVEDTRMSNVGNYDSPTDFEEGAMVVMNKVPEFKFVNQNNDTITNSFYDGKVYVIDFFFSTCPSICPIMTDNMLDVQEAFKDNDDFGIASFSIDPTYDTSKVLQAYAESYGANHPNWNFLTGNKSDVMTLSNEGFKLYAVENEEAEGGFEHSGMFALVDKEGNIQCRIDENGNPIIYYNGLEESGIQMLIEDIKKLL
ncbi:SCO family protein [Cochleicola gelatinilyticus]|uniref:Photosynthetic protein synthase II n=1 Tax=Cochleicola gelatinilyticus TaxID=1763537 RepID=A0A167JDW3_9FLAO|nr:SCO family protein [Cochleicola gelatinilyticus]OAB80575.1 photosynthetic protein synthase II [Cochleicola gelatinilyticus]